MEGEGLHATVELIPKNLKGRVKPVKLTYLFDLKEIHERTPDGEQIVVETASQVTNEEYFIDGIQVTCKGLAKLVATDYPHIDLMEVLDRLYHKGLAYYNN